MFQRVDIGRPHHVTVFIKLMYKHCFEGKGGGAEHRGAEGPKVANILRVVAGAGDGGAEGTGGQRGLEWGPGTRAKPPPP